MALQFARQAMSLDSKFAAVYGVALARYGRRFDQGFYLDDVHIAEGQRYTLRAVWRWCFVFSLAGVLFFGLPVKDAKAADALVDQATPSLPKLGEHAARSAPGWVNTRTAALQFQHAMRLSPLDAAIYKTEFGVGLANFFQRRFEIALSWRAKIAGASEDACRRRTVCHGKPRDAGTRW